MRVTGVLEVVGDQSISVKSSDADASISPFSGVEATNAAYRLHAASNIFSRVKKEVSVWSHGPVRVTKSDERVSELTQCACPDSVLIRVPVSLFQTFTFN